MKNQTLDRQKDHYHLQRTIAFSFSISTLVVLCGEILFVIWPEITLLRKEIYSL